MIEENNSINELVATLYMVGWVQSFWSTTIPAFYDKRSSLSVKPKYVLRTVPEVTKAVSKHYHSYFYEANLFYKKTGTPLITDAAKDRPFELLQYYK